ncbi:MAG TPA: DUF4267 domain-containing protein [Chitinophaga sp.]|uniref:DUF4267 domain-containing protein n=1 Tax=Chitinophaga sp. TaxID=1869181 RepID=UPI002C545FC8|nr:DUF4267 domain-containing protein [Chitinophaga sp.]HVI45734.1 DUF4267 domain-containing protein [Chitinophaga sp.]
MKQAAKTTAFSLTIITGLLLVFIGVRFLLAPLTAEDAFGIHVPVSGDYSFHYIKGIRDLFSGAIIVVLLLMKEYRALGWLLLLAMMVPVTDMSLVVSHPGYEVAKVYPHATAVVLAVVLGIYYIRTAGVKR